MPANIEALEIAQEQVAKLYSAGASRYNITANQLSDEPS